MITLVQMNMPSHFVSPDCKNRKQMNKEMLPVSQNIFL